MSVANCPSCAGPVEFQVGSSAVVVCTYCRSVVARTDRGSLETLGKVAALIDTGSSIHVNQAGHFRGTGFRVTGRTQMRHQAGGIWDEWYAAFDDGRWGWLAEAQGRYYITFQVASTAPPLNMLDLGVPVPAVDNMRVAELGEAELASAEGEIPWRPTPGDRYDYADLSGPDRRFATIDYSEDTPLVFKGFETDLGELGIAVAPKSRTRASVARLNCSKCGGPLDLKAPDSAERIWCPNCGAGHDIAEGNLHYLGMLKAKKVEPTIPLGSTGTFYGTPYVVAGFVQRYVTFDDVKYYWNEYLLYAPAVGYRWLVESDEHWSFVTPLRPGDVQDDAPAGVSKYLRWNGKRFKLFQDANATVSYVLGEFYWKVEVGEKAFAIDYIAAPEGISKEISRDKAKELNYSHSLYLKPAEVEEAFGIDDLARPSGVGPTQPFPGPNLVGPWLLMAGLLIVIAIGLAITRPRRIVVNQSFELAPAPASASWGEYGATKDAAETQRVFFTEPFELTGGRNLRVSAQANVDNSWVYLNGDIVNEGSGGLESFEMPLEYYHGVSDGESWSEGRRNKTVYLSSVPKGRYSLRVEAQWDPKKAPPPVKIEVREGVFRAGHFVLALFAISIIPLIAAFAKMSWELKRWKDSSHSPYGTVSADEEE